MIARNYSKSEVKQKTTRIFYRLPYNKMTCKYSKIGQAIFTYFSSATHLQFVTHILSTSHFC